MRITREVSFFRVCMINHLLSNEVPHRDAHEKQLKALQNTNGQTTKILAGPHFPYDANTLIVECDSPNEDGGFSDVTSFVEKDPYVTNKIVSSYKIQEFAL